MNEETIKTFAVALEKACQARDKSAKVSLFHTPHTSMTGEYMAAVQTSTGRELYAFNPASGNWIICYQL